MQAVLQAPSRIYLTVSEGRERISYPLENLSQDHIAQTLEKAEKRLILQSLENDPE